jgi:arylformamidase
MIYMIYDITLPISPSLPVWPGDPPVSLPRVAKMEEGEICNLTRLEISAHTGTHVDAPFHFLPEGSTVESLDLQVLIGPALVVHLPDVSLITAADLEDAAIPQGTRRLLLKTRNSEQWAQNPTAFNPNYVAIAPDAAEWLVARGIRLVGVDYLSVAPFEEVEPTHKILLAAEVIIVEGLNLAAVPPGAYTLYCLPLKIPAADGAPARAVLMARL